MAIAMPLGNANAKAELPRAAELDPGVLARCKAQDPMAFRAFVVRYERPVFALLSRFLGRGPHVEDLAQETFLRAFRAFPAFDLAASARPSTWLLTIATRLALDAKKRKAVPLAPLEAADADAGAASFPEASPEAKLSRAELGRALERAAAQLTDDHRAALVLFELHGLSLTEISAALGVPENTVKTRLYRARQHMREMLSGLVGDDGEENDDG